MASISTPVWALVRASPRIETAPASGSTSSSTSTNDNGSGWQSGISSAVRLAAWMPAMRAVPTTSPFGRSPAATSAAVSGAIRTTARATARRSVTSLPPTSTIRARPSASVWVSRSRSDRGGRALRRGDQVAHGLLVARPQQLDRVGVAVHDRLEEDLAVLVGRQRALRPATRVVQHLGKASVRSAVLVGDLALDPLGQRGRRAGRGDRDRQRPSP